MLHDQTPKTHTPKRCCKRDAGT